MMIRAGWADGAIRRQLEKARNVNKWPRIIQDWLYPPTCLLCGDPGSDGRDLCRPCAESLPYIEAACPHCALPLASPEPQLCGACQKKSPAFDSAFAPLRYEEPVRHLIQSLKFGARYPAARLLGTLLGERLHGRTDPPEALIPVPLHAGRYRERGFNQAIEIARTVSHYLEVPLDFTACRRLRATPAQARLSAKERRRNLRQAFATRPDLDHRHVAIVDDVVTTGTTVNEVARALRRAGVEKIEVWACARAGHSSRP
jgi:ComF family protein